MLYDNNVHIKKPVESPWIFDNKFFLVRKWYIDCMIINLAFLSKLAERWIIQNVLLLIQTVNPGPDSSIICMDGLSKGYFG